MRGYSHMIKYFIILMSTCFQFYEFTCSYSVNLKLSNANFCVFNLIRLAKLIKSETRFKLTIYNGKYAVGIHKTCIMLSSKRNIESST